MTDRLKSSELREAPGLEMESARMSVSTGDVVCAIAQTVDSIIMRMEVAATVDVEVVVIEGRGLGLVVDPAEIAVAAVPEAGDVIVVIEIAVVVDHEGEIVIVAAAVIEAAVAAEEDDEVYEGIAACVSLNYLWDTQYCRKFIPIVGF